MIPWALKLFENISAIRQAYSDSNRASTVLEEIQNWCIALDLTGLIKQRLPMESDDELFERVILPDFKKHIETLEKLHGELSDLVHRLRDELGIKVGFTTEGFLNQA